MVYRLKSYNNQVLYLLHIKSLTDVCTSYPNDDPALFGRLYNCPDYINYLVYFKDNTNKE